MSMKLEIYNPEKHKEQIRDLLLNDKEGAFYAGYRGIFNDTDDSSYWEFKVVLINNIEGGLNYGEIVGYIFGEYSAVEKKVNISSLYVKEGRRMKGYGKELYKALYNYYKNLDTHFITLSVYDNGPIDFYTKLGFELVGYNSKAVIRNGKWIKINYLFKEI